MVISSVNLFHSTYKSPINPKAEITIHYRVVFFSSDVRMYIWMSDSSQTCTLFYKHTQ